MDKIICAGDGKVSLPPKEPMPHRGIGYGGSGGQNDGPNWTCKSCGKLLGVAYDNRVHVRFARGVEYEVGLPVVTSCRRCGVMNIKTK